MEKTVVKAQKWASRDLYNNVHVANYYAAYSGLQPPETAILLLLQDRLAQWDLLEVGVGAGRTTQHIASLVRRYVGTDIAEAMVEMCRKRFPMFEFAVADAEDLSGFADASFDFVLFSFNGIDCLDTEGRHHALEEFHRVLRPGGCLAFSSHNVNFIPGVSVPCQPGTRLLTRLRNALRFIRRARSIKFGKYRETAYVVERHFGHSIPLLYVTPAFQTHQLVEQGWTDIDLFPCDSGMKFTSTNRRYWTIGDPWIYYLCHKAPASGVEPDHQAALDYRDRLNTRKCP
jgi:ubiquinone/menaquinone biosynthesis C-methylase UbiE